VALGEVHDEFTIPALQAHCGLGEHEVRTEYPGLLARPAGELMPADAVREARVVPDHRAVARPAAGNGFLQHDRLEALGGGIDSGGEAGWPRPDNDDVALGDVAAGAPADRLDNLGRGRLNQRVAVVADHDREP
jgi:hypothetical protein